MSDLTKHTQTQYIQITTTTLFIKRKNKQTLNIKKEKVKCEKTIYVIQKTQINYR